mmetsp:Transcript_139812/g.447130  ORF Transcript_139812/g.447130 Transcript_139812/m.447130 type:complete len:244 (+) Transcript_139812:342-1073(+)
MPKKPLFTSSISKLRARPVTGAVIEVPGTYKDQCGSASKLSRPTGVAASAAPAPAPLLREEEEEADFPPLLASFGGARRKLCSQSSLVRTSMQTCVPYQRRGACTGPAMRPSTEGGGLPAKLKPRSLASAGQSSVAPEAVVPGEVSPAASSPASAPRRSRASRSVRTIDTPACRCSPARFFTPSLAKLWTAVSTWKSFVQYRPSIFLDISSLHSSRRRDSCNAPQSCAVKLCCRSCKAPTALL